MMNELYVDELLLILDSHTDIHKPKQEEDQKVEEVWADDF